VANFLGRDVVNQAVQGCGEEAVHNDCGQAGGAEVAGVSGLVFPSVFSASVLVAIAQTAVTDLSFTVGLIAALVGILAANAKTKTLF